MQKSEDLAIEVSKALRDLFESIGVAKASFRRTPELDGLINRVFEFRPPAILGLPAGVSLSDLEKWKTTAVSQLQQLVESEYTKPINALLEYLHSHAED